MYLTPSLVAILKECEEKWKQQQEDKEWKKAEREQ